MSKAIVVIHGVGQPEPAEIGRDIVRSFGFQRAQQATVLGNGHPLTEFKDQTTGGSIIEVNWADLMKPRSSFIGVLRHVGYVITSMLDVAAHDIKSKSTPLFGWLFRFVLLVVVPGSVIFTLATAIAVSFESDLNRRLTLLLLILLTVPIVIWLWRLGHRYFAVLWEIAAAVPIVAVSIEAFYKPIAATHQLVQLSGSVSVLGLSLVIVILILAVIECWVRRWNQRLETKLTYMAFLYLPFIAMSGLTAWLGVLALSYISDGNEENYRLWEATVWGGNAEENIYKYALIEVATTVVIGGIGIFSVLLPAIGYWVGIKDKDASSQQNRKGQGAQNGIAVFLAVAPVCLVLLLIFSVCVTLGMFDDLAKEVVSRLGLNNIIEIYKTSVLRTLPYILWLTGPFALFLDVLGDVLFYIQPKEKHSASIAKKCKERLEAAINYAESMAGGESERKVVILAHSQGSIIASDLRAEGKCRHPLLTAGSPINSLYLRFLGIGHDETSAVDGEVPWVNCYRESDVIAGPIPYKNIENIHIGPGGHTNYWSDNKVANILTRLAEQSV